MFKAVIYKEWIKTGWFLIILTILALLTVAKIFLTVQHNITFSDANNYWYYILFQSFSYESYLKFVPLVIGLTLASAQYIPEITDKRIKLTFHLPLKENNIMLMMLGYGVVSLLGSYLIIFLSFAVLSNIYFPAEVMNAAFINIAPWLLAGFVGYFMAALVILEAIWKYRAAYFVVGASFIMLFFESSMNGAYAPALPLLAIISILSSISLLFSAYRFRKGEM